MDRSTPQLPHHTTLRPASENRDVPSGTETPTPHSLGWNGRLTLVASEEVPVMILDERTSEWVCTDRVTIMRTYV